MRSLRFSILLLFLLSACTSATMIPGEGIDAEIDLSQLDMRHSWKVFTGPERTVIGVNDVNSIERGRKLFTKHCQACHGPNGEGDGPLAKQKKIKPANLKNLARNAPNYYLVVQINNGKSDMPRWQDLLTPEQTWDLTNFIQSLGLNE